ncbi:MULTISPECIES: porin [Parabacteroides]|uniref:porin n=1 Tax=Parabacteroides TaxID=375288 RepID=UPI00189C4A92|nr:MULTISPECIES: porin [Parabacteroides]MBS1379237.1 hypothetical protein [Parabacteroides sp.]MDB8904283.1 porin [Parabacteroides merdae]MDB8906340.1 porin [Parabacteroides merdae]
MKRLTAFWLSACFLCTIPVQAQSFIPERDSSDISLFEYATKIPKRNNVFNLDLEMHASFNTFFTGHKLDEAAFRFNHIKIEATGEVNDRLFYWYRQNLNQGNEGMDLENLPESIEYAMIGYRLNDKFTITLGKQDAAWGGFEYDLDPYAIYEYSDMNEYMDCYFTGVTLGYQPTPSQELRLQVTDNRIGSMEDTYGILPAGIEKPRAPLFYTFNWNSSYLDEILNLRYSATVGEQAKGKWMYMAWAGHNVCTGPFDGYFDVMYTRGSLDPLGILTELVPPSAENEEGPVCLRNIQYLSLVAEMNYRFHPKWNAFAKGMYETGSVYKAGDEEGELPDGKYRTAWGLQTGIEFYPMADENLHIFLTGTARFYNLTEKAKALCASIENTQRLSVGFIYKLPLY